MPDPKKVFVIHGRNEDARKAMFAFLRSIGLQPLEWTDAVDGTGQRNPFIGEILDSAFGRSQAIIALLTGDDIARLGTRYGRESFTPQARPNVIFEAGMALGRFPERTILIQLGNARAFSDIAGRHILEMDDSVAKRQALARRLQSAGCAIQVDTQTDWHTEGKFEQSVHKPDGQILGPWAQIDRKNVLLSLAGLVAIALAVLFWFYFPLKQSEKPPRTSLTTEIEKLQFVTISGHVKGHRRTKAGIIVGIATAGAVASTDSEGSYTVTVPIVKIGNGATYNAFAYEVDHDAYISSLKIKSDQSVFDITLSGK